jgi:dTDP-4-amino-4,6-dideoxygalactose transaminase
MPQPFVDLKAQFDELRQELLAETHDVFAGGGFIGGDRVRRFETEFAALCESAHCVGVANGTDALHLALRAVGVGAGQEVITVPNTFVATVEAIRHCGAHPVFVDIHRDTLLMDAGRLDAALTRRTRAVVPVHLYGQLADMEAIAGWCAAKGLSLVEDAAQAHGARRGKCPAGAFGDAAGFSFYPSKNLGAAGDAGAVVTNRPEVAQRVRLLRDHGLSEPHRHSLEGYNSRLDALQAAVLSVKLRRLSRWNERRRALTGLYRSRLEHLPGIDLPAAPKEPESHVHHLFVVRCARRDALRQALAERGIETGLHYALPVHLQPAYRNLGYAEGRFPIAEAAAREVLSLPLYPQMTEEAVLKVCDAVEAFVRP